MKWIILLLIATFIITSNSDYSRKSYLEKATEKHNFSILFWEIQNLPDKWLHLAWELFPGNKPNDDDRLHLITEYLNTSNLLRNSAENLTNEEKNTLDKYLDETRARTEESIESIISNVLINEGLGITSHILIPPTDFKLDAPPNIVVTSPRDKISFSASKLISNQVTESEKKEIESIVESDGKTSALVDRLGGLGTYPAFVSDKGSLRNLLQTASHEWLHNYWILHPLGQNMWDSNQMIMFNETAANIAGDELGDMAFESIGGVIENPTKITEMKEDSSYFNKTLKETRLEVEYLLDKGNVEKAEKLMNEATIKLQSKGYKIRKINQAYFAFHGNYADSPSATNPIGDELTEYRNYFGSVGEFIQSISKIKNYDQFLQMLDEKRSKSYVIIELNNKQL